jgi:Tfp pilus assembly protein PilW
VHLADLLTAAALLGLVLSATLTVLAEGQRAYVQGAARVESQQNARVALARMAREIRQASGGAGLAPLSTAEPSRIVLQQDTGKTVTWQLSADALRRNAGAGAQPIVNGVRALVFTYRDADGRPTTTPADVRSVAIALTTAAEHPGAGSASETKLTTEVRLRNR